MRKNDEHTEAPLKSRKAFWVVYVIALIVIIGIGVYSMILNTGFVGTMYSKYGGSSIQVIYGPFQYFMLAGILILPAVLYFLFKKHSK